MLLTSRHQVFLGTRWRPRSTRRRTGTRYRVSLLARMAGSKITAERLDWTLLGAGSLGSKLALHLARAGSGPTVVVDKSVMCAPHNAARHALVPETGNMQIFWGMGKACKLSQALTGLDQSAEGGPRLMPHGC